MSYKKIKEKAARYKELVEAGEKVFKYTLITESELDSFIERLMGNSDWDNILADFCVTPRGAAEWYDNAPSFSYEYDELDHTTTISLSNSESAFREEDYLYDIDGPEELYQVIINLVNEFIDYYQGICEDTIKKCQEEGSCYVNGWWLA